MTFDNSFNRDVYNSIICELTSITEDLLSSVSNKVELTAWIMKKAQQDQNFSVIQFCIENLSKSLGDNVCWEDILYDAIKSEEFDFYKTTIESGVCDVECDTQFTNACSLGKRVFVEYLFQKHSADLLKIEEGLCWACLNEHFEVVKYLIEQGVSVDCEIENMTPLLNAIESNNHDLINLLIDQGKADVNYNDCDGLTPLASAIEKENIPLIKKLLVSGVSFDYDQFDQSGESGAYIHNLIYDKFSTDIMLEILECFIPYVSKLGISREFEGAALRMLAKEFHQPLFNYFTGGVLDENDQLCSKWTNLEASGFEFHKSPEMFLSIAIVYSNIQLIRACIDIDAKFVENSVLIYGLFKNKETVVFDEILKAVSSKPIDIA
ncbi:MAG: ankyrin repeat domain-containing protein, partial [Endozoicomonadaceae bacterium]|nr:ankyrin repeat domain-containing protein [Endozoicomonadaceae bacterium]